MIEDLFNSTHSKLKAYLKGYLRDKHEVEDIAQSAWLKLAQLNGSGKLNSKEHAEKMLYVLARTMALNHIKKHNPQLKDDVLTTSTGAIIELVGAETMTAHDALVLLETIDAMPKTVLQIFNLMRIGLSESQIAERLGISYEAVMMRWLRYTRSLSGKIEKNCPAITLENNTANSNTVSH